MTDVGIPTITEVNLTKDLQTGEKFLNSYKLISKLGSGHSGKVYLVEDTDDHKLYAIKEINKLTKLSILNKDPNEQLNKIQNEIDIMKTIIDHPKIMKLHKVLNDPKVSRIFLVLEYCSKSELKFGSRSNYAKPLLQSIIRDVVLGLEYLHGIGIIHRDIKPSNLLRNDENFIKISDFGISVNIKLNQKKSLRSFGTPAFLAPELVSNTTKTINSSGVINDNIDENIDIWALGVSIYCLWFGSLPFNGSNEYELFQEIINNEIDYEEVIKINPEKNDKLLISLLKEILVKDPKKRISIKELKSHPYLLENLNNNEITEFLNFNQHYLQNITNDENASKSKSIQTKFRSIFRRRSSATQREKPKFSISTSFSDTLSNLPNLSPTLRAKESPKLTTSPSIQSTTSNSTLNSSSIDNNFLSPRPLITNTTSTSTFSSRPLNSKLASSSNSLNLNSLLRSKKEVPNYLDDSTFFQYLDSDESSSDDSDEDDDDSGTGLYNDDEDTLSFRIGPKRNSSLQVKTVNEYLDV